MSIVTNQVFEAMIGDPDDHRPRSEWALVIDPDGTAERVDDLAVIKERIAPGDRIPVHVHRVSEVIFVHGPGSFRLGEEARPVEDGTVVFIPAGTAHGLVNDGSVQLPIEAVFPTTRVWIQYLERNPAPGTENAAISPPVTYDFRTGEMTVD